MAIMVSIYVLVDVEGLRRYVGKYINPSARLKDHQRRGKSLAVSYEVLETCDESRWTEREKYWIAHGRLNGWPLENITDGGEEGVPNGFTHTAVTRDKISAIMKGRSPSISHRAALSKSLQGHQVTI